VLLAVLRRVAHRGRRDKEQRRFAIVSSEEAERAKIKIARLVGHPVLRLGREEGVVVNEHRALAIVRRAADEEGCERRDRNCAGDVLRSVGDERAIIKSRTGEVGERINDAARVERRDGLVVIAQSVV
jgi:hypothetical protein